MHCELVWRCQVNRPSIYPSIILYHYPSINIPSHLCINSSVHPSSTHSSILPSFNPSSVHLTIIFHQLIHPFILCPSKSSLCSPIHPYVIHHSRQCVCLIFQKLVWSFFMLFICCWTVCPSYIQLHLLNWGVCSLPLPLPLLPRSLCLLWRSHRPITHTHTHTHTGCVLFSPSVFSSIV